MGVLGHFFRARLGPSTPPRTAPNPSCSHSAPMSSTPRPAYIKNWQSRTMGGMGNLGLGPSPPPWEGPQPKSLSTGPGISST